MKINRSGLIIVDDIGLLPVSPDVAEGFHLPVGAARTMVISGESGGGGRRTPSLLRAILRKVRVAVARLRAGLQRVTRRVRGTAGGTQREIPASTRVAEKVQGAMTRQEDLPVPGFNRLDVTEIRQRLRDLSRAN